MKFLPYESKPITRWGFQITSAHEVAKLGEATYIIAPKNDNSDTVTMIKFKAYEEPKVGDWVVRLTDEDTYHCTDEVFRERNIVTEE